MRSDRLSPVLIPSLYLPWLIATTLQDDPILSFWFAWGGSFFIFYQTWFSFSKFVLPDLPSYKQIMRPLFLQQLIFAGFMCCTSVFYFLDAIGYEYFTNVREIDTVTIQDEVSVIAYCQRLSLLGHAALVTGILIFQKKHLYNRPKFYFPDENKKSDWIIKICIITFILSIIMENVSGLYQFSIGLYNVAIFSGAVILVRGITQKKIDLLALGSILFVANFVNATLSGFKEHIIVSFIILACLLYPNYKRIVTVISIPLFLVLFYILPTYANIVRSQSWGGKFSAEEARTIAIDAILSGDKDVLRENNWAFLTERFSEINMFTEFVTSTPKEIPYYGLEILENSLFAIVPRVLWPGKPITETQAMERVYNANVVERGTIVSAKTRPIVDAYLSAGAIGIFIYMLLLGSLSQWLNNTAENILGGYAIGSVIFFNGFFQILWRGETTEFLLNSVFWSFIMMMIVFRILRNTENLKEYKA